MRLVSGPERMELLFAVTVMVWAVFQLAVVKVSVPVFVRRAAAAASG
jgi:hypothetical protein